MAFVALNRSAGGDTAGAATMLWLLAASAGWHAPFALWLATRLRHAAPRA